MEHIEEWKTEPKRVFQQLLKPSSKIPKNRWEDFFLALYKKNVLGMWLAMSRSVLYVSAGVFIITNVDDLLRSDGFQVRFKFNFKIELNFVDRDFLCRIWKNWCLLFFWCLLSQRPLI